MAKFWFMTLALILGVGLASAPLAAQDEASEEAPVEAEDDSVASTGGDSSTSVSMDKNLGWSTGDDAFNLNMSTRVQFRMTYSDENGSGDGGGSTDARDFWAFQIRRAETTFQGHIFEKEWKYKLTLDWTSTNIKHATMTWAGDKFYNITVGQAKVQFNWQEITSSGSQMMVERSTYNQTFNQDYAKGITVDGEYADDSATWIKYWVGVYNGVLVSSTDFRNSDRTGIASSFGAFAGADADLMFNLRLETYPLGEFTREGRDARGADEKENPLFSVGLALNMLQGDMANTFLRPGSTTTASGRNQGRHSTMAISLDAHLRWFGINFDIEYTVRKSEFHNSGTLNTSGAVGGKNAQVPSDLEDQGILMEAGYMLDENLQFGLRYGYVNGDEFTVGTDGLGYIHDSGEMGVVVNYFLHGQNLKATLDITYTDYQLVSGPGAGGSGTNATTLTGITLARGLGRGDASADHQAVWQFRVQLQWIF